jgi:hypothetical protein
MKAGDLRMPKRSLLTLNLLLAPLLSFAQPTTVATGGAVSIKSDGAGPSQSSARPVQNLPRVDSYSPWEFWNNVTIQPGDSVNLDSSLDYSSSDSAKVTVLSANGANLGDLVLSAFWAVPTLKFFNAADVFTGDGSYYSDARAFTFPIYGSQFRLRLTNHGASAVSLAQVLIFTRAL